MSAFLSDEWVEAVAALYPLLPPAASLTASVTLSFPVARKEEKALHWVYRQGQVEAGAAGAAADGVATFSLAPADAEDVLSGRVSPSVAFMRGRLKASGEGGAILAVLASTVDSRFEQWRAEAAAAAGW